MSSQSQELQTYLPVYDTMPDDWADAKATLVENLKKMTNVINTKERGTMFLEQIISGGQLFGTTASAQQPRTIYRTVVNFGGLPNATTTTVPHNINIDVNFTLVDLFISATNPTALTSFSLKYWSQDATEDILISLTSTNIVVKTLTDYSAFTRSIVVIEYVLEL